MRSFFDWFAASGLGPDRPWLVLGKGPTFARRRDFDLGGFRTVSLNHAVREQPVDVAHIIDADVVDHLGEDLLRNAGHVVMPWRPHVKNDPGPDDLGQMAQRHPLLRRLADEGRLLWYNLSSARPRPGAPIVVARYFSAEAAIHLLAQCGVRTIRSLGIDGGSSYSASFQDLVDKTLLANGRQSFDQQFEQIAKMIAATGLDFAPLDVESPVRVAIRATAAQAVPAKVLASSLRRRTSITTATAIHAVAAGGLDDAARRRDLQALAAQHGRGRGLCLDATMLALRDVRPLWLLPMRGAGVVGVHAGGPAAAPDLAVALFDAALVAAPTPCEWRGDIAPEWRAHDRVEPATALVDFVDAGLQPWISRQHPFAAVWCRELLAAIEAGHASLADVAEAARRGHVRPSLLAQVERRLDDPMALPAAVARRDRGFVAPTGVLVPQPPVQRVAAIKASWQRTGLPALPGRLRDCLARWLGRAPYA